MVSDNVNRSPMISSSLATQVSTIGRPSQTQEKPDSGSEGSDTDAENAEETPVPKTLGTKNLTGKRKRPSHNSPIASSILESLMDRQEKADKAKAEEDLRLAREKNDIERQRVSVDYKRADTDEKRARLDLARVEMEQHALMTTTWEKSHEVLGKWYDRISRSHPDLGPEECFKMAQDTSLSTTTSRPQQLDSAPKPRRRHSGVEKIAGVLRWSKKRAQIPQTCNFHLPFDPRFSSL